MSETLRDKINCYLTLRRIRKESGKYADKIISDIKWEQYKAMQRLQSIGE